jgi:hypothetical protein
VPRESDADGCTHDADLNPSFNISTVVHNSRFGFELEDSDLPTIDLIVPSLLLGLSEYHSPRLKPPDTSRP